MAQYDQDQVQMGERLRRRRRYLKMTQQEVADLAGVSQRAYAHYETGRLAISAPDLIKFARAMEVPVGYFYSDAEEDYTLVKALTLHALAGFHVYPEEARRGARLMLVMDALDEMNIAWPETEQTLDSFIRFLRLSQKEYESLPAVADNMDKTALREPIVYRAPRSTRYSGKSTSSEVIEALERAFKVPGSSEAGIEPGALPDEQMSPLPWTENDQGGNMATQPEEQNKIVKMG